jgi:hypothetical protein
MKKKILVGLLLAGSTMFAAPRVSFGVSIGAPGPVRVAPPVYAAVPPCPGPGYVFVNGFWRFEGVQRDRNYRPAARHFEQADRFDHSDRNADHSDRNADHFRR